MTPGLACHLREAWGSQPKEIKTQELTSLHKMRTSPGTVKQMIIISSWRWTMPS